MTRGRTRRALAAVTALAVLAAAPAAAATPVADVAAELADDPLFVDPGAAGAFTETETEQLRARLETATTPVFLAVLPDPGADTDGTGAPSAEPSASAGARPSADAPAPGLAAAIAAAAGRPGTYGLVAGTAFHAVSTVIGERAAELADTALGAVRSGAETATALLEFVDQVELVASQLAGDLPGGPGDDGAGWPFSAPDPWVVAFVAVGGLALLGWRRHR